MKRITSFFLCLIGVYMLHAQKNIPNPSLKRDSIVSSYSKVGLGMHIIGESGKDLGLYNSDRSWHINGTSWRLSYGKFYDSGLGLDVIGSFGKYAALGPNTTDKKFYGLDLHLLYDLKDIIGESNWFDPFIGLGTGYSEWDKLARFSFNTTIGLRIWMTETIGTEISTNGKWVINADSNNYLHHAVGLVYRFKIKKALSKKGKEKLVLVEAYEKVQERIKDSIVKEEIKAKALAEQIENERLAKIEKEKNLALEVAAAREKEILEAVAAVGKVYFDFDKFRLRKEGELILDQLVTVLNKYPKLRIEIGGYTDSRGSEMYNQRLSLKRAEKTASYLFDKGIDVSRIIVHGKGESNLLNECENGVPCSSKKHKKNRRTEFIVIKC